jgi:hypothetical protein
MGQRGSTAATFADLSDKNDCINAPNTRVSGIPDYVRKVEIRLLACFNYASEREIDHHNLQAAALRELEDQIERLERRIDGLEERGLEERTTASAMGGPAPGP